MPPEEFLDGIFGSLMRDPVKLPSSGIVVDRFNAEKHLRHSATDLMDGSPLEIIDLIEMPELSARLSEWRQQLQVCISSLLYICNNPLTSFCVGGRQ